MRRSRAEAVALIVLLFGLVSLLGDASYEGFRSLLPADIRSTAGLGATIGLGDFVAYGLRPLSGLMVDLAGGYWAAVFLGYGLIPIGILLALYGGGMDWLIAGYLVERMGKAIRGPARDHLLSEAAPRGRRGLVFGIHEAMDQAGAVAGPLIAYGFVSGALPAWSLAAPGALTVAALAAARRVYSSSIGAPPRRSPRESLRGSRAALALVAALGALTPSPLAVAHVAALAGMAAKRIPLLYAAAMASDALAAIPLGLLHDRSRAAAVAAMAVSGAAAAALALHGAPSYLAAAALASGVVEAGYETVARAMARGATGYGALGLARGVAAGGSILLYGLLYSLLH